MSESDKHNCISPQQLLSKTKHNIQQFGLQVITVTGDGYQPSFAYSIGLYETYNHPEIICFALSKEMGHIIINDVANLVKAGESIEPYKNYDNIFKNSRAEFLPVDERNIEHYFGAALNFYEPRKFTALQLIWTDRNDRLPWEDNFEEEFVYKQPLLDRNAGFKFREAKNLGIFTTKQWLEDDKPILRVIHDNDGDWQFLTGDQMPGDIRLVALEQMVLKDNTLNEVFSLNYGQCADRDFIGDSWITSDFDYDEDDEEGEE